MERNIASELTIHKIEQGEGKTGCDPRGIQVVYKESRHHHPATPNRDYLSSLLTRQGYKVRPGDEVSDTPIHRLCVLKDVGQLTRREVLEALSSDDEIDVRMMSRP